MEDQDKQAEPELLSELTKRLQGEIDALKAERDALTVKADDLAKTIHLLLDKGTPKDQPQDPDFIKNFKI